MRARATFALTAAALLAITTWPAGGGGDSPAATSAPRGAAPLCREARVPQVSRLCRGFRDAAGAPRVAAGLAWAPPAGWRPVAARLNDLASPAPQLAAATFAVRPVRPDRDCRLDNVHAQLPAGGALVLLLEDREAAGRPRALKRRPARPDRFPLAAPTGHECFGLASTVAWTEQGRAFEAVALFGARASAERRRQASALLDSLAVQAIPPPPPPAGWRVVVSGSYDSLRVPPGWKAWALKHPHATQRPRTLFRLTGPGGAVLRVTDHRRGPGSPAFPPASEPLVFDAHHRAGIGFRGFRFSIRIDAQGPAAELAEISARSLGLSGVGRG